MEFVPGARATVAVQDPVPVAVPDPPVAAFDQVTVVTPAADKAVPDIVSGVVPAEALLEEGLLIVTEGPLPPAWRALAGPPPPQAGIAATSKRSPRNRTLVFFMSFLPNQM
jgi:hypothetical protein